MREVERIIREQLIAAGHIRPAACISDTACMEKHIAYSTDTGLLNRGRTKVVTITKNWARRLSSLLRSLVKTRRSGLPKVSKRLPDTRKQLSSTYLLSFGKGPRIARRLQIMSGGEYRAWSGSLRQRPRSFAKSSERARCGFRTSMFLTSSTAITSRRLTA